MVEVVLGVIHEIKLFFSTKGQACPGRLIYQYFAVSGSPSLMPLQSLFAPLLYCCSKLTFTPLNIFYLFQFCELSLLPCDSVVSALAFLSRSMLQFLISGLYFSENSYDFSSSAPIIFLSPSKNLPSWEHQLTFRYEMVAVFSSFSLAWMKLNLIDCLCASKYLETSS